jgi:hypothetical protein
VNKIHDSCIFCLHNSVKKETGFTELAAALPTSV